MNTHEEEQKEILFSTRIKSKDESLTYLQAESLFEDLFALSKHMNQLYKEKNWQEHNKLVPLFRKMYNSHDFGFEIGEIVNTNAWSRWEPAQIIGHNPVENSFFIRNERGWECSVSGFLIRSMPQETYLTNITASAAIPRITQMSLF